MFLMAENKTVMVNIADLRPGMFVYLDLGWMSHPFPSSSFKISNDKQVQMIRSLNLSQVRYSAEKSDPEPTVMGCAEAADTAMQAQAAAVAPTAVGGRTALLVSQRRRIAECEERFSRATQTSVQVAQCLNSQPEVARDKSRALVADMLRQMQGAGEAMIHLLSDGSGERAALHPVNVTVICLLLGKAMGLAPAQLEVLGMAALLHDVGKAQLPERVRWRDPAFSVLEDKIHQEHVALSVSAAQRMGLGPAVALGIAQHHEMVDGSGFPLGIKGDSMTPPARILALVNRYDNLCNPANPSVALTPHEALAQIFAQFKLRFDAACLNAFIRLMGVYPPGSVVQLVDDRYALVMSVNSTRPLRPVVILHNPEIPKDEAVLLSLEDHPMLGIKRSLKPMHLPEAAWSYLSPRKRISYFFDQAVPAGAEVAV
jgi:putative nucleotidyltransferase with HDIG domain